MSPVAPGWAALGKEWNPVAERGYNHLVNAAVTRSEYRHG